jgi:hypothetical protein
MNQRTYVFMLPLVNSFFVTETIVVVLNPPLDLLVPLIVENQVEARSVRHQDSIQFFNEVKSPSCREGKILAFLDQSTFESWSVLVAFESHFHGSCVSNRL